MPYVGSLNDVPDGGMSEIEIYGEKVLLVRDGESVSAIAGTCPHAGAPLIEGVLHRGRVICPWHKAAFCARTGALLEPPAVDGLKRFDVSIENGRIALGGPVRQLFQRRDPAKELAPPDAPADRRCFVIIGAGAAGAIAAQTLREEGFAGRLLLLESSGRLPYDRTVLSKYEISGQKGAEKSPLQSRSFYEDNAIVRLSATVRCIDPVARTVTCADEMQYRYNAALLATGADPVEPPIEGVKRGFTLRHRADAAAIVIRAAQAQCRHAVILGAGFIGMEVAASLRERGLAVTVVARESAPFERQLGPEIGGVFTRLHEQHGVAFRFGSEVSAIERDKVVLQSGEALPADLVVIGAGVKPVVPPGLSTGKDGGISVDRHLRVTDGLYAAGDIARFPLYGDGDPVRVEHWRVAQQQGRVAALNMLGRNVSYDAVPVFWTIQYLKRLDYIGHAWSWDEVVVHGDLSKPEFIAYYVKDGVVAAAAGLDRDKDMAALVALFEERRHWRPEELGDSPAGVLKLGAGKGATGVTAD